MAVQCGMGVNPRGPKFRVKFGGHQKTGGGGAGRAVFGALLFKSGFSRAPMRAKQGGEIAVRGLLCRSGRRANLVGDGKRRSVISPMTFECGSSGSTTFLVTSPGPGKTQGGRPRSKRDSRPRSQVALAARWLFDHAQASFVKFGWLA